MSVFEVPTYVTTVPLPAPLTSGSGVQSYTDPTGEVWVAANTVKGGNWYRAKDVLKCRISRTAVYNLPTGAGVTMVYDTANKDDYTMYNTTTGIMAAPVIGWYRVHAQIQCGAQAIGSFLQITIYLASTSFAQDTMYTYSAAIYQTVRVSDILYATSVGQQFTIQTRASTAAASSQSQNTDYCTFEYLGSG